MRKDESNVTGERLTWEEIKARYPNEHVAIVDAEGPPDHPLVSGVVSAHHPDQKTLLRLSRGPWLRTIRFTGQRPIVPFRIRVDVD